MQQRRTLEREEKYRDLRRKEKQVHRKKKRAFENRVLEQLESLMSSQNMGLDSFIKT